MHGMFAFSFCLSSMHSFFNFGNSINFLFISLFFVVNYNIFILIFSSIFFFYFFQVCIRYLYSSYPCCYFLICFNNPCFYSSTIVNVVLNDLTSKPRLPIVILTIAIAWNISTILLLPSTFSTNSFTDFGVNFCGVSFLVVYFDYIPMFFICKPKSISNPCPFVDPNSLCDNIMVGGLKSCIVGPNTSIYCSWNECDYYCSIYGYGSCTSIGISSWTSICTWKSYKSSTASYYICLFCSWSVIVICVLFWFNLLWLLLPFLFLF